MLLDDRHDYPMSVFARLRFDGRVDFLTAQAAYDEVVARHPFCRSRVITGTRGQRQWAAAENAAGFRVDASCSDEAFPLPMPIDLRKDPGFQVTVGCDGQGSTVVFRVHHACSDGIGLLQIIEDWLLSYDRLVRQRRGAAALRAVDTSRLPLRNRCLARGGRWAAHLRHHMHGLERIRKFFVHRPIRLLTKPLAVFSKAAEPRAAFPAMLGSSLDAVEFQSLHADARRQGVTLNTMFLRDLFVSLAAFQAHNEPTSDRAWLRIAVPINMRTGADQTMPAANQVSMVFLDRRPCDMFNSARLLDGLHKEMQVIKQNDLGLTFLLSLQMLRLVPGGLSLAVAGSDCSATCVLSNLGEPLKDVPLPRLGGKLQAGNMSLESFDFLPPVRPGTAAAFGIFSYAGELRISLHYDSRSLSVPQAEQLLDVFTAQLNRQSRQAVFSLAAG